MIKLLEGRVGSLIYNLVFISILAVAVIFKGFAILFSLNFDLIYMGSYVITGLILRTLCSRI
jgi:hypothetical protein